MRSAPGKRDGAHCIQAQELTTRACFGISLNGLMANRVAAMDKTDILGDREQRLLKTLVERYIEEGRPVGSRALARESGLNLSPATVRNVMADLEEMGLVTQPHTSAGRVPTVQGYRTFVDRLLMVEPLDGEAVARLQSSLAPEQDTEGLLDTASSLLSGITHLVGLVSIPRVERVHLRRLEFLPLSDGRVLVILVVNEREVQNRIIRPERTYTESELTQAANYINSLFSGKDLMTIRASLLQEMERTRERLDQQMREAISMARQAFEPRDQQEDFVIRGETNLLNFEELAEMDTLRQLFEAFGAKRDILHLLDHCIEAEGVQIFIGEESGYEVFDGCSVVTSPYSADGEILGALGVIGPTRMSYDRVIPVVDVTAKLLGSALNQRR